MIRLNYRKLLVMMVSLLVGFVIYNAISITIFSEKRELIHADAAIVLGAAVWGKEPSPVFRERIRHGIWLYENGYVDVLIFTGGMGENDKVAEAVVAERYAIKAGVPGDHILIETQSQITEENLSNAKQVADRHKLSRFLIVSDPLHMKRAMVMAKDYGLQAYSSPTPTSRYQSWKSKVKFLAREVFYYSGYVFLRYLDFYKSECNWKS